MAAHTACPSRVKTFLTAGPLGLIRSNGPDVNQQFACVKHVQNTLAGPGWTVLVASLPGTTTVTVRLHTAALAVVGNMACATRVRSLGYRV